MSTALTPGFADPVADAQACFRAVLDAMAHPGQVQSVPFVAPPAPLCTAAAAVVLTLVDQDAPLSLDPATAAAASWISFHTGVSIVEANAADFVLAQSLPDLTQLANGTDEAPETAATVIIQVASLTSGARFQLAGPGLRVPSVLTVDGLPGATLVVAEGDPKPVEVLRMPSASDEVDTFRVLVTARPDGLMDGSQPIDFVLTETATGKQTVYHSTFMGPPGYAATRAK